MVLSLLCNIILPPSPPSLPTIQSPWTKRIRTEGSDGAVIVSTNPRHPPPSYHHHPPPPPITHLITTSSTAPPSSVENHLVFAPFSHEHASRRRGTIVLSEDWGHIDKVRKMCVLLCIQLDLGGHKITFEGTGIDQQSVSFQGYVLICLLF